MQLVPDEEEENAMFIYSEPDFDPYDSAVESGVDENECSECRRNCVEAITTCQTELEVEVINLNKVDFAHYIESVPKMSHLLGQIDFL